MSLLDSFSLIIQVDRAKLLSIMQDNLAIAGTAIQPPFSFVVPGANHAGPNKLDLIIKSVQLSFEPGTTNGTLHFGIEAGVIRPDGMTEKGFTGGELLIHFSFQRGFLFAVKLSQTELKGVPGMNAAFATAAGILTGKIIEADRQTTFELFQFDSDNAGKKARAVYIPFLPKVIDAATAGMFFGDGDTSKIQRSISANNSFSVAVNAEYTRQHFLCRAILKPEERDNTWEDGLPPTDIEVAKLPPPCGTGVLARGDDRADVNITSLNIVFRDGFLDINGTFDAEDTCWKVRNGNFQQKAVLNFIPAMSKLEKDPVTGIFKMVAYPPQIHPVLDPAVPHVNYDVEILFICKVIGFIAGIIVPEIGGVILGAIVVAAMDIGASLVDPNISATQIQNPSIPTVEKVQWRSINVTPEGLWLQGDRDTGFFPDVHQPSSLRFEVTDQPINGIEGPEGETVYQALFCEPKTFKYRPYYKDDVKSILAVPKYLLEPVNYQWFVNGTQLSEAMSTTGGTSVTELRYIGTIKTAVPPPDGIAIPSHEIVLGYTMKHIGNKFGPVNRIILNPRAGDKRYDIRLEMQATDAAGRKFFDSAEIHFEGMSAIFGQDYKDYLAVCFKKMQEAMKSRAKSLHPKPGEPQQGIDRMIDYVGMHIAANSPAVTDVINAAVKMHGLEAVSKAMARNKFSI